LVDLPALPHLPKFSDWVNILKTRKQKMQYVRLHGRNKNWYEADEKKRYDYLYTKEELDAFKKDIIDLSSVQNAIFFNNCFSGKALRNAFEFKTTIARQ
jgi:uncharacterized protein YecE (DUF72 family)